ncbi:MAG: DoxX family membrane protein [Spirochaetes bacterium]|jgi:uncharacterized membrane protein YphA (DoxX/SURF4 family)|nr:DoxX family membrane protein [Spirochaetota bacterium]
MDEMKGHITGIFYGNGITFFIRIFCGLLFFYSGFFKVLDLENFGKITMMYDILPPVFIPYTAIIVPVLELALGLLFLFGYKIRAASFITILLMLMFMVFIGINIARGKNFDCGCFELSYFGIKEEIGIPLMLRDAVIVIFVTVLFYAKKHLFSLESLIEKIWLKNI